MENQIMYSEEINFLKENFKNWKDIPDTSVSFQLLTGISNAVYRVTTKADVTPKAVILRKFGDTESVVDKEKEAVIFNLLAKTGRGPKCYAQSSKYRSEEFFDAAPIKLEQINEAYWRRKLAAALAKYHSLSVSGMKNDHIILERLKNTTFYDSFNAKCSAKDGFSDEHSKKLAELRALGLTKEREFVMSITPSENLVFSHNDTLNRNILISKDDQRVILIDYEYSGYNNRAYDAANLFVESMMTYDNPSPPFFAINAQNFPKLDDIKDFARYYLYFSLYSSPETNDLDFDDSKFHNDAWLLEKIEKELDNKGFEREMQVYLDEFQKCCLLSQYYWITWAVLMCKPDSDPKSFDYISFAHEKFQYYLKWKELIQQSKAILE